MASAAATFRFPGAAYGLAVGTGLLASLIGPARAKDLIYSGRHVKAEEAKQIGLVDEVFPADDVYPKAVEAAVEWLRWLPWTPGSPTARWSGEPARTSWAGPAERW